MEALPNDVGVTHLLLGRNMIKREGAISLATFMKTNNTLKVLDLSTNRLVILYILYDILYPLI